MCRYCSGSFGGFSVPILFSFACFNILYKILIMWGYVGFAETPRPQNNRHALVLTSDFVQMIPIFDSLAFLARSNTPLTPASVIARPMRQTANISLQFNTYRSVIFKRAVFRSRRPRIISGMILNKYNPEQKVSYSPGRSTRMSPLLKICAFK